MAAKFQIMYDITLYVEPGSKKCNILEQKLKEKNIPVFRISGRQAREVLRYTGYSELPLLKLDNVYMPYRDAISWVDDSEKQ